MRIKITREAMFPKTARNAWARIPDRTPPDSRATPVLHILGMIPTEEAKLTSQSSRWQMLPSITGDSRIQTVRSTTGRPL